MKYTLPLKEREYRQVVSMIEGNSDFALFKINKVVYVLCSGNACGLVQIGGAIVPIEDLLKLLIKNGLAKDDIIGVRTISSYGAYQHYTTIDGITIGPAFVNKGTLNISVRVDMDCNYTLEIQESESDVIDEAAITLDN